MCALTRPPVRVAPTAAPIALGSIAAGLQMMEIDRVLAGRSDSSTSSTSSILGIESFHDLATRAAVTTRLVRNAACRFDHRCGPPALVADVAVPELAELVPGALGISVLGRRYLRSVRCQRCRRRPIQSHRFLRDARDCDVQCRTCRQTLVPTGMELADELLLSELNPLRPAPKLSELGMREGELLFVRSAEGDFAFEFRAAPNADLAESKDAPPRTILVVGLGNIGSNLVDALVRARSPAIERLILVDPDSYDASNLAGQRIEAADVGRPKAIVQARYVLRRRPFLSVVAYVSKVEDIPAGVLRGTLVASCVDSRASRQSLAEMAWRMGAPLVDAAVDAALPAVRIAGYRPGPDAPCLECSFHDDDYAALEQTVSCRS